MSKEHLEDLFEAYYKGWATFEYRDDKDMNVRNVYVEMQKFMLEYAKEKGLNLYFSEVSIPYEG